MAKLRVIESLCRSLNNLLEHLHQSFFFYFILSPGGVLLGEPGRFVSIGTYLPAAMIVAASFTITAIGLWIQHPPVYSLLRQVSTLHHASNNSLSIGFALSVIAVLHGLGFGVFLGFDWVQKTQSGLQVRIHSSFMLTIYPRRVNSVSWYSSH